MGDVALNLKPWEKDLAAVNGDVWKLPWVALMEVYRQKHIREIPGPKADPKIAEWLKRVGEYPSDETAWCAAGCNGVLHEAGFQDSHQANARSLLTIGYTLPGFVKGAIVVFWRVSPTSWQGHVGLAVDMHRNGKYVQVLGCNQGNAVSLDWFPTEKVLGYRWPKPVVPVK